jgi:hypothetical protein
MVTRARTTMTWSQVRTHWLPLREQVRGKWSRLSREDIEAIAGRRHKLIAFLRLRYELSAETAAAQADTFVRSLQVLSL